MFRKLVAVVSLFAIVLLFNLSFSQNLFSASTTPAQNIEGTYKVQGTNPNGGSTYEGTAVIKKQGERYLIHWSAGAEYDGTGTLNGNTLAIEWGTAQNPRSGTITYTVNEKGVLSGTWSKYEDPKGIGKETLTPYHLSK